MKYRFVFDFDNCAYSGYHQSVTANNYKHALDIMKHLFPDQKFKCIGTDCPTDTIVLNTKCNIGDILFTYNKDLNKLYKYKVVCIHVYDNKTEIELAYCGDDPWLQSMIAIIKNDCIGVDYFFTEDEALGSDFD